MDIETLKTFVADRYADEHAAKPCTEYADWRVVAGKSGQPLAALAYKRAADERLFLESYLDRPIEQVVSGAFARPIARAAIVEIGCLAAAPSPALARLWLDAAEELAAHHEIAVATLTLSLRAMFARIGMPFVEIVHADADRLGADAKARWGSYYAAQPILCAGNIKASLAALYRFGGTVGQ